MKIKFLIAASALACVVGSASADGFVNGGFENGSTSSWTTGGGYRGNLDNSTISPAQFLPGGANYEDAGTRGAVVDKNYIDPNVGAALGSTVYSGNYAYRAENTVSGGYATAISQSVGNYSDANIFFAWKAVLENGGHSAAQSAIMTLTLVDNTTGDLLITRSYNAGAGGVGVDTRFTAVGDLYYTPTWQIEQLAIDSSRSGHDFTLSLLAADCEPTGHTGYAYLDGFGGTIPPVQAVPEPETYAMLLAGLCAVGFVKRRKSKS